MDFLLGSLPSLQSNPDGPFETSWYKDKSSKQPKARFFLQRSGCNYLNLNSDYCTEHSNFRFRVCEFELWHIRLKTGLWTKR
jgi:hypothetical protein